MGRHANSQKQQAEKEKQFIESNSNRPADWPNQKFEEGTGEAFNVKITRASNGYILTSQQGEQMVFSDDKYNEALLWIVSRRLKQMLPGEELELLLEQRFTKLCKTTTSKTQQESSQQLVA